MTIHPLPPLPPVPTQVTAAERKRRQDAVDFSRASVRLEGFVPSEGYEIEAARFVTGEIDMAELTRRTYEIAEKLRG